MLSRAGVAQSQEKAYAVMIYNFAKGIKWPATHTNTFVIGVWGYTPLADELTNFTTSKKIENMPIVIKELSGADDAAHCNILFIPAFKAKGLPGIIQKFPTQPTLIITNKPNMARMGSGINFVLTQGKIQYEINSKVIEARGLKVPSVLKGMGITVE